jgi:hypothetical protein
MHHFWSASKILPALQLENSPIVLVKSKRAATAPASAFLEYPPSVQEATGGRDAVRIGNWAKHRRYFSFLLVLLHASFTHHKYTCVPLVYIFNALNIVCCHIGLYLHF